jgi:DNA-binding NarL/FixJ family response regulator
MMKVPTRVLLVADDPVVLFGLRQIITTEPDLSICAQADTIDAALHAVTTAHLAVVDLSMEAMTDLELIRQLHHVNASVPVLVFSMHDETRVAERAFRAGARGYVTKGEGVAGLIRAIRDVLDGRWYPSPMRERQ